MVKYNSSKIPTVNAFIVKRVLFALFKPVSLHNWQVDYE